MASFFSYISQKVGTLAIMLHTLSPIHIFVHKTSFMKDPWSPTFNLTVTWWHHQKQTFSALLVLYAGNSLVIDEFLLQRPVTRSVDVFFDLNGWVHNRDAGDLRRHHTHCDLTVMRFKYFEHHGITYWCIIFPSLVVNKAESIYTLWRPWPCRTPEFSTAATHI